MPFESTNAHSMSSKSRTAQERLVSLEKSRAAFEDQLLEAAKFVGIAVESLDTLQLEPKSKEGVDEASGYYGREKWLLRWLLKKLQASKDEVPRQRYQSWQLLQYLMLRLPLQVSAQTLVEMKFPAILKQTLEEVGKVASTVHNTMASEDTKSSKKSLKRKRHSEVAETGAGNRSQLVLQLESIHQVLDIITSSAGLSSPFSTVEQTSNFTAEYMKSVLRTSAEEAATILGLWLSFPLQDPGNTWSRSWVAPFIELWKTRFVDEFDALLFSRLCTKPLLRLIQLGLFTDSLKELGARSILIPARVAFDQDPTSSDILSSLTKLSVIQDPSNAPILFDIAIRATQTRESRRRKPQDESWLQEVFVTLQVGFIAARQKENCEALHSMLQAAVEFKVKLDLPTLRRVASKYALLADNESDWKLVAVLLKLDGNVFLIPDGDKHLIDKLLASITKTAFEDDRVSADMLNEDILIPLMNEFARARDLTGFIRHWYTQLVEFANAQQEACLFSMPLFCPWEEDPLQEAFSKFLEPSLNLQQILQTIEWLSSEVENHPNAVCVILQALAGSISREETVDAIGLRLFHIIYDNKMSEKLDGRNSWRFWSILSRTLDWLQVSDLDELVPLLESHAGPFASLFTKSKQASLLDLVNRSSVSLETPEIFRCACALWTVADGTVLEQAVQAIMLDTLKAVGREIKVFLQDLLGDADLGEETCGGPQHTIDRGIGWTLWSFVGCILVDYPKVLVFALVWEKDSVKEMLKNILWICSASNNGESSHVWLKRNPKTFPDLWTSALKCETVLNCRVLTDIIVGILSKEESNLENPLIKKNSLNDFAIQSLHQLPLDTIPKWERAHLMAKWRPQTLGGFATEINPAVLSLKIKMMHRPTFYESMKFEDLSAMADIFQHSDVFSPKISLALYKELVRLTISQMIEDTEQRRRKSYLTECLTTITNEIHSFGGKRSKYDCFAHIALVDATASVLFEKSAPLFKAEITSHSDFLDLLVLFKNNLLLQLKKTLKHIESMSLKAVELDQPEARSALAMTVICLVDAISSLGVAPDDLSPYKKYAKKAVAAMNLSNSTEYLEAEKRLETLLAAGGDDPLDQLTGDVSTLYGRQELLKKTQAAFVGKDQTDKLKFLNSIISPRDKSLPRLDQLMVARQVILSCGDSRKRRQEDEEDDEEGDEEDELNLSIVYTGICGKLWKSKELRQFCLTSETMEMMLRTKGRCLSQWDIDSTLGSIAIICSRNGPSLRPNRSGTIYLHLCHLMQAVFTSHWLKLQGHFHLVVQVMQTLLRCLFVPLPHSTTKITKFMAPPPWLSSPKHQLTAKHATAYTRLITLICDPSVQSVTRSTHNNLTSAKAKAKGMAVVHMQYVLTTYIRLQLEMRMAPEIREKMIPGIYAIFDTTTPEVRKMINESLDSSGRSVFGTLYRDYVKFGKWKGS
ncbi:Urb2/Npa2 family-domain-containing protein [Amylocarpus encephaloides]|uniref:Urb2/Npa2 family-domain-containing protein n=1 Tax=Amylocarpus encephaloides TaxID=45428 RepID=A0A9P8CAA5_9HELO|nr:Urb2/Npa2 family-domain-containing protein [Amylocarpus encephaloides]